MTKDNRKNLAASDVWFLGENFPFEGDILREAIAKTFERRRTAIPTEVPLALTDDFARDGVKQAQWLGFVRKGQMTSPNIALQNVVGRLREFLTPVLVATLDKVPFEKSWESGGGWK